MKNVAGTPSVVKKNSSRALEVLSDLDVCVSMIQGVAIREHIDSLLEMLEEAGCFVLRKGTIESYYFSGQLSLPIGKPSSALDEAGRIHDAELSQVEAQYKDILCALNFASQAEAPDEPRLVNEVLLSAITPVLSSLDRVDNSEDVSCMARQYAGVRADIFSFSLEGSGKDKEIKVDLNTEILDVEGFPLIL